MFLSKDFIETREGLVFAVVEKGLEQGRVLCFLRYVKTALGFQKLSTEQSNKLLLEEFPRYLFYSPIKEAKLHAVPVSSITIHHQPRKKLQVLLAQLSDDPVIKDMQQLVAILAVSHNALTQIGVTGSLLIGAQQSNSDIDLVFYDRGQFFCVREHIKNVIGKSTIGLLTTTHWEETYARRGCDLSLQEYIDHEQRKYNKALINGRKFDIALLDASVPVENERFSKLGPIKLVTKVVDASYSYDYPARFALNDTQIKTCLSYTATYTGQAEIGDTIEICGLLEQSATGQQRIIVGSSREAKGEYIKVVVTDE